MIKKQEYIGAFLDGYFHFKVTKFGIQYYIELEKATEIAKKKWKQYKKQKLL